MPRPKKPAAPAADNTEDFADILGSDNPGPLPGSNNMPDIPIEAEPPAEPVATADAEVIDSSANVEDAVQIKGFEVITEFRDISNFNQAHRVGSDVSYFPSERLATLLTLGYVKEV